MSTISPKRPSDGRLRRAARALKGHARDRWKSFASTAIDPTLPLIVLGVIGADLVAILVFKAPAEIGLGILFIGGLTAFLETKMRNDHRDR
jgi:hypothetical protein